MSKSPRGFGKEERLVFQFQRANVRDPKIHGSDLVIDQQQR
jgi:hypothetical protein